MGPYSKPLRVSVQLSAAQLHKAAETPQIFSYCMCSLIPDAALHCMLVLVNQLDPSQHNDFKSSIYMGIVCALCSVFHSPCHHYPFRGLCTLKRTAGSSTAAGINCQHEVK